MPSITPYVGPQTGKTQNTTPSSGYDKVSKHVPEQRYLRELGELQELRVDIQDVFDHQLRVPATGYLREMKLFVRILLARLTWFHRVTEALERAGEMQTSRPTARELRQYVSSLRSLDAKRKHLWEILQREFEIEMDQEHLHPSGWTIARELFKLIEQILEMRRDTGLLGVDLDAINDDEPSSQQMEDMSAIAS